MSIWPTTPLLTDILGKTQYRQQLKVTKTIRQPVQYVVQLPITSGRSIANTILQVVKFPIQCILICWLSGPRLLLLVLHCFHEGCPEDKPAAYTLIQFTLLLVEKAGVEPDAVLPGPQKFRRPICHQK